MCKPILVVIITAVAAGPTVLPAVAGEAVVRPAWQSCASEPRRPSPWSVDWNALSAGSPAASAAPASPRLRFGVADLADQQTPRRRTVAFEYSEGYKIRAKIHKVASIATVPLFVAEYLVGQNLYNHPFTHSDSARSAHTALAASTGVLFGVNTITGVWNLIEARKDPNRSTRRTIHGILMLIADAGFAITGATAPESDHDRLEHGGGSRSTHRAIALTSMGIATVSYLLMLFGGD